MVSVSVSKNFGIEKSIGIGFEKIWYRKKYRYRFRKKLVSKKVSVSVSKNFGIEKSIGFGFEKFWYRKKYRYRYRKKFGIEKSIGFGIEKIWYRKKVSDSVSFRFWVSSHTASTLSLSVGKWKWLRKWKWQKEVLLAGRVSQRCHLPRLFGTHQTNQKCYALEHSFENGFDQRKEKSCVSASLVFAESQWRVSGREDGDAQRWVERIQTTQRLEIKIYRNEKIEKTLKINNHTCQHNRDWEPQPWWNTPGSFAEH